MWCKRRRLATRKSEGKNDSCRSWLLHCDHLFFTVERLFVIIHWFVGNLNMQKRTWSIPNVQLK